MACIGNIFTGNGVCAPLLHKERKCNTVAQIALVAITLGGITLAIVGSYYLTPVAVKWGIGVSVVSFVAFGILRCCSSTESERQREAPEHEEVERETIDEGKHRMDDASRRRMDASKRRQEESKKRDIETRRLRESREEGERLEEALKREIQEKELLKRQLGLNGSAK